MVTQWPAPTSRKERGKPRPLSITNGFWAGQNPPLIVTRKDVVGVVEAEAKRLAYWAVSAGAHGGAAGGRCLHSLVKPYAC